MPQPDQHTIIEQLQKEVLSLQKVTKVSGGNLLNVGPSSLQSAFPGNTFPVGAVHELLSTTGAEAAATTGFITALLGTLMQQTGACIWVSTRRTVFPAALQFFGVAPERIIFIDAAKPKDALWAIEEALKCNVVAAVVGELSELSFTQSRRLQLAVENSGVTGFIHRTHVKTLGTVACVTRWQIKPIAGSLDAGMPGVGFPRWEVQLLKVRNGKPGIWQFEWSAKGFRQIPVQPDFLRSTITARKTG